MPTHHDAFNRVQLALLTPCVLESGTTIKLSRTYKGCWNDVDGSSAENRKFHPICGQVKQQTVLWYDSTAVRVYFGWRDRDELLQGSRGCEQAAPRSAIVSVQQDVALDDLSIITLPHISLCGGGGPRYPSLLQGNFSSIGMGLLRYVRYHPQSSSCLFTLRSGFHDRDQLPISNLFIPVDYIQAHPPPLVPPL